MFYSYFSYDFLAHTRMRDNYNVTLKIKKDDKRLHMSKKSSTFAGYFGFLIYQTI